MNALRTMLRRLLSSDANVEADILSHLVNRESSYVPEERAGDYGGAVLRAWQLLK